MSYSSIYLKAQNAFETWRLLPAGQRIQAITELQYKVPDNLKSAYQYQASYSKSLVENELSLISPTGETNELYVQGRGTAILLVDSVVEAQPAAIAFLVAILMAGNSVIVCTDDKDLIRFADEFSASERFPKGLIQVCSADSYLPLINEDIRSFALIGNSENAIVVNQALAAKPNAITSLVAETDFANYPTAQDPKLVLRFITERVRTTNITAIGGNAMLLELGSDSH